MNTQETLIAEFGLGALQEADRQAMLAGLANSVQKRFLLDVYEIIGKDSFDALLASMRMGKQFYVTTLKHLIPDYERIFIEARAKVAQNFRQEIKK